MRQIFFLFLLLLSLTACSGTFDQKPELTDLGEHFSEAMRWQDYIGAGRHLQEAVRRQFLDQFQLDEDLRIVESQVLDVELNEEVGTAEVDYRMQYYRLPSMRVKKWQWRQQCC